LRVQRDEHQLERLRRDQEMLQRTRDGADYQSFEAFYSSNEERRGNDESIAEIADGELRWQVSWLPRTSEVIAVPVGWLDESAHRAVHVASSGLGGFSSYSAAGAPAIPEMVLVLGRVASLEQARRRLAVAASLDEVRAVTRQED
jgi:hypothetical protein